MVTRTVRTFEIADHLWEAIEAMAAEMDADPRTLVNQALFNFVRVNGYFVPGTLARNDTGEPGLPLRPAPPAAAPSSPPFDSLPREVAEEEHSPAPASAGSGRVAVEEPTPEVRHAAGATPVPAAADEPDAHPLRVAAAGRIVDIERDLARFTVLVPDRDLPSERVELDDEQPSSPEGGGERPPVDEATPVVLPSEEGPRHQAAPAQHLGQERLVHLAGESARLDSAAQPELAEPELVEGPSTSLKATGTGQSHSAQALEEGAGSLHEGAPPFEAAHEPEETPEPPPAPRRSPEGPAQVALADGELPADAPNQLRVSQDLDQLLGVRNDSIDPERGEGDRTVIGPNPRQRLFAIVQDREPVEVTGERFLIGRDPKCDLVVTSDKLSRQHAAISIRADGVEIEDLDSSNGTWFGEERVDRRGISDGDEYALADVLIRFEFR